MIDAVVGADFSAGEWWRWSITALIAVVGLGIALTTYVQKSRADRRAQWWERARWAIECVLDAEDPDRVEVGLQVLEHLAGTKLAGVDELEILDAIGKQFVGDGDDIVGDTESSNARAGETEGGETNDDHAR